MGVIDVGWEAKEREFLLDGVEINLNNQKINESNLVIKLQYIQALHCDKQKPNTITH